MSVTVGQLVAAPELSLHALVEGRDMAVTWAHSSDLVDPTPFLDQGHVLLTTGSQLGIGDPAEDEVRTYVHRLADRGIAGLGLGVGLTFDAAPSALVETCRERAMTLFEVPYRVPFLALARWVAAALAAAASARDAWSVTAQRAIALAALSNRRLDGVLSELARQLPGQVLLLDAHGSTVARHGRGPDGVDETEIWADARRLLARNTRAAGAQTEPGWTVGLQTLGRRDHLRGVLATITVEPPDAAATAVVTGAVALTELSLEDRASAEAQQSAIDTQLFRLLLAGETDLVREVLATTGRRLPDVPVRVLVCRPTVVDTANLVAAVLAHVSAPGAVMTAPVDDVLVLLVEDGAWSGVAAVCKTRRIGVGVSGSTGWTGLAAALASGRAAWTRTDGEPLVVTADAESLFGLLPRGEVSELASRRLEVVLDADDGVDLLRTAETWLQHDARYDRAARELDVHRHSVKAKVRRVGVLLGLDLQTFDGKAELWALLRAR